MLIQKSSAAAMAGSKNIRMVPKIRKPAPVRKSAADMLIAKK